MARINSKPTKQLGTTIQYTRLVLSLGSSGRIVVTLGSTAIISVLHLMLKISSEGLQVATIDAG